MSEIRMRVDLAFTVEDEIALRDEAFLGVATAETPPGTWSKFPQHQFAGIASGRADSALTNLLIARLAPALTAFTDDTPGLRPTFEMHVGTPEEPTGVRTMDYNAIAEVAATLTEDRTDAWIEALDTYAPAVSGTHRGHSEIVITLPAATFDQAVRTALAVLTAAVGPLTKFAIMPTAVYDEERASD